MISALQESLFHSGDAHPFLVWDEVRVPLSHGERCVSEELLDFKYGVSLDSKPGREGVPKRVKRQFLATIRDSFVEF
jgi:hypothetical protein